MRVFVDSVHESNQRNPQEEECAVLVRRRNHPRIGLAEFDVSVVSGKRVVRV